MASGDFGSSWRKSIPPQTKKFVRLLRDKLVTALMVRLGWRPAGAIPLNPVYLQGSYGFDDEDQIKADLSIVHRHSTASFERLASLWHLVRYLDRQQITGALVECGVWKGGAAALMALAHMRSTKAPYRAIHLFDSFEGLPQPNIEFDGEQGKLVAARSSNGANGALDPIGQLAAAREDSEALFQSIGYPQHLLHYHVGWFQQTIPPAASKVGDIALLRLAGDWYESTILPLKYLYQKVVQNGAIAVADYGAFEGSRLAVDEFLKAQSTPIMLHHVDAAGRYWIKP